jgi:hypothetical protein
VIICAELLINQLFSPRLPTLRHHHPDTSSRKEAAGQIRASEPCSQLLIIEIISQAESRPISYSRYREPVRLITNALCHPVVHIWISRASIGVLVGFIEFSRPARERSVSLNGCIHSYFFLSLPLSLSLSYFDKTVHGRKRLGNVNESMSATSISARAVTRRIFV